MFTFAQLKDRVRRDIWPAGEPKSTMVSHNHMIVDALIEIQKYVECFQANNTQLVPHCATHYNCGLTSFDVQRGRPKKLSVVSKAVSPVTSTTEVGVLMADAANPMAGVTFSAWPGIGVACLNASQLAAAKAGFDYETANTTNPAFWKFTFDSRKLITSASLQIRMDYCNQNLTFQVQASNDNTTWTTLHSVLKTSWTADDILTFTFANTSAYLHYRITITPENIDEPIMALSISGVTMSGSLTPVATSYTDEYDWCGEVVYDQVDACLMANYLSGSIRCGSCLPIDLFFGLPRECCGGKGVVPVPTDEGLPAGLPILPLGYHYPQESTDSTRRATRGVWAIERGRIVVAPWIQSTEMIVLRIDGIKREWSDGDLVEEDPDLIRAVKLWVQKESARDDDRDLAASQDYERQFNLALQDLWHECRQETLLRECEPSYARGIGSSTVTLYYNDQQQYTATCPDGQTGSPVTVTIPANTVGSSVSKADANSKAYQQAQSQARAQLVCEGGQATYWNTVQTYTASCAQTSGHPAPEGDPVTVTIPAGTHSSTVSQADADALALAAARASAEDSLSCVWKNAAVTVELDCPDGDTGGPATGYVGEGAYTSTISQADADARATAQATSLAEAAKETVCSSGPTSVGNTPQTVIQNWSKMWYNPIQMRQQPCAFRTTTTVTANKCFGATLGEANTAAIALAQQLGQMRAEMEQSFVTAHCDDIVITV